MSLQLLPDDPQVADAMVKLMQDKHAALMMLRRMREERDSWREAYMQLELSGCPNCREVRRGLG